MTARADDPDPPHLEQHLARGACRMIEAAEWFHAPTATTSSTRLGTRSDHPGGIQPNGDDDEATA